jgi:hypothetical protein
MTEYLPEQDVQSEILDLHVDPTNANLVVVTPQKLRIMDLAKAKIRWALEDIVIGSKCEFRAARFGSKASDGILFVVLNAKDRKACHIQRYKLSDWKLSKTRRVSNKPVTAFATS